MINPKMREGAKIEYTNANGWREEAFIEQQYKSVTGVWCLRLHTGHTIRVHEARLLKEAREVMYGLCKHHVNSAREDMLQGFLSHDYLMQRLAEKYNKRKDTYAHLHNL